MPDWRRFDPRAARRPEYYLLHEKLDTDCRISEEEWQLDETACSAYSGLAPLGRGTAAYIHSFYHTCRLAPYLLIPLDVPLLVVFPVAVLTPRRNFQNQGLTRQSSNISRPCGMTVWIFDKVSDDCGPAVQLKEQAGLFVRMIILCMKRIGEAFYFSAACIVLPPLHSPRISDSPNSRV